MDDLEADEFAARLLMPERLILKSQFSSYQELSKEFLVSDQACYKRLSAETVRFLPWQIIARSVGSISR